MKSVPRLALWSVVIAMTALGEVAPGRAAAHPADPSAGFVYRDGRFSRLDKVPGSSATVHIAINDFGQLTGTYVDAGAEPGPDGYPAGTVHGFVKSRRGAVTRFDVADAVDVLPQGINDRGTVAGIFLGRDGVQHGFVRDPNGRLTRIDVGSLGTKARDINDAGDVVGIFGEPADNDAGFVIGGYLRSRTGRITTIALPGAAETDPHAINNRGQIVGAYLGGSAPGRFRGFLLDKGRVVRIDPPGAVTTIPLDVNDRGQISGGYVDGDGRQHGFLYSRGRYTTIDAPRPYGDGPGTIADGLNDRGQVVIPEPVIRIAGSSPARRPQAVPRRVRVAG